MAEHINSAMELDPVLRDHVFWHMLQTQLQNHPPAGFLETVQQGRISPVLRQRVADWMMETAEMFQCERELFCTSITYVDRYMARVPLPTQELQLLAAAALVAGAKLVGHAPLHIEDLCCLMDGFVNPQDVKEYELRLVSTLGWRLEVHKPHDFLEEFLRRLALEVSSPNCKLIVKHAWIFIDMCYADYNFVKFGPAIVAATALYWAVMGVGNDNSKRMLVQDKEKLKLIALYPFFDLHQQDLLLDCIREARKLFATYDLMPRQGAPPIPSPTHVCDVDMFS